MPELAALLVALRSEGAPGDVVMLSMEDASRAVERYLEDPMSVGITGPFLCITRRNLVRLIEKVIRQTGLAHEPDTGDDP